MNKKSFAEKGIFRKYKLWINISVFFAFIITIILYKKQKKPKQLYNSKIFVPSGITKFP